MLLLTIVKKALFCFESVVAKVLFCFESVLTKDDCERNQL